MHNYGIARHLKYVFNTLNVDLVLDVGANQGQYRDFLRNEVEYLGNIVSFEPIPELFAALQKKFKIDRRQHFENIALGAAEGELMFNVMNTTEFSSFLTPTNEHTNQFAEANTVARTIMVKVATLNKILPGLQAQYQPAGIYLKIDTQGFDRQVIEGGSDVLGAIVALQTEMSVTQIYEGMSDYRDMLGFLQAQGFSPSGFFPLSTRSSLRMIEFDACMINNKFL
jgi:FkbM family methyltransferase